MNCTPKVVFCPTFGVQFSLQGFLFMPGEGQYNKMFYIKNISLKRTNKFNWDIMLTKVNKNIKILISQKIILKEDEINEL